jgi:2-dehydrotetronate isomerase
VKLAANISFLFTELPPLERIAAAREAGFDGIELLFPYDLDPGAIRREAETHGMTVVQINSPPGNREAGQAGFAAVPGCEQQFQDSIRSALDFLREAGSSQLHVLAGVPRRGTSLGLVYDTYVRSLQWAADTAAAAGVRLTIEPINSRDVPGYALSTLAQAANVLRDVARENVGLQFDLYHSQIMGGDLTHRIRQFAPLIRHVQIAGAPDRNEPDRGEVNLSQVLMTFAGIGYDGWISGEYRPSGHTHASLQWLQIAAPFRQAPASSQPAAS